MSGADITGLHMSDKLTIALHEAEVYKIGATSDFNQRIILDAAKETHRLRALLREGLELPKSWEDWFARVRKELDRA